MKGSEWALNALRNFKDFFGVEEYFSTCVNCSHKKTGAMKSHLYCSWDVYSLCNILMQWGGGGGAGAGANKTTVFKLGKKELL